MKTEALKLADELDELHQYVPSEAPAMIRRLVEEIDCLVLIAQHHEFVARNLKMIIKEKDNV